MPQGAESRLAILPPVSGDRYADLLGQGKGQGRDRIHSFHRYFGKLIPAIPRFAIREFTSEGDWILDPFCGSGTTLVEARLAGCNAVGVDLNPLSVLISRAKTADLSPTLLGQAFADLAADLSADVDGPAVGPYVIPPCPNLSHWFRPEVIPWVVRIRDSIARVATPGASDFFFACLSAVLRDLSNADPRHVFPGYSKRLRALDAAGLRVIDPPGSFLSGTRRRLRDYAEFRARWPGAGTVRVLEGSATDLPAGLPPFSLVVTNPPYLGSIRYLETVKLEMYWLDLVRTQSEYLHLDSRLVATERVYREEYASWQPTGLPGVDEISLCFYVEGLRKMSLVVRRYFTEMAAFLGQMRAVLQPGGHLVIKISDPYLRRQTVPVHEILIMMAAEHGFRAVSVFPDSIKNRSLLSKRNSYSGMLPYDWILVLRRGGQG